MKSKTVEAGQPKVYPSNVLIETEKISSDIHKHLSRSPNFKMVCILIQIVLLRFERASCADTCDSPAASNTSISRLDTDKFDPHVEANRLQKLRTPFQSTGRRMVSIHRDLTAAPQQYSSHGRAAMQKEVPSTKASIRFIKLSRSVELSE
jgi:hypothetical protein